MSRLVSVAVLAVFWGTGSAWSADAAQQQSAPDRAISAQPLAGALEALGRQSGLQIVYVTAVVEGKSSRGAPAQGEPKERLEKLLEGTGLTYKFLTEKTVSILALKSSAVESGEKGIRVAQREERAGPEAAGKEDSGRVGEGSELEEIVVTGTQISGATPSSRVSVYTRGDIENQGFGSIRDFIEKLPSNFSGGASQNTVGIDAGGGANAGNTVAGTGVNLRGLGNDATLVLLNGQRIAPASRKGNFVDISMIPLSVIDRMEVMADGASALYGSDSAGGVINIILRKNFEGAETTLRYGSVTSGPRDELRASQLFGHSWEGGSALFVYDFSRDTPLYARDRDYTKDSVGDPYMLLPKTTTHTGLVSANQALTDDWQLSGNGSFTTRDLLTKQQYLVYNGQAATDLKAYSANVGLHGALTGQLALDVSSSYSKSHYKSSSSDIITGGSTGNSDVMSDVLSFDAKLSGEFGRLPAGALKFAVGGQFRDEKLNSQDAFAALSGAGKRNVSAAFAEVHVPLLASRGAGRPAVLELELADRQEHYSDFGNANNPKAGLLWRALPGLTVRTSYGTSFVAPALYDLNPVPYQVFAASGAFIDLVGNTSGSPDSIFIFGGNPDLKPQESENWSLGLDFASGVATPYKLYGNYFRTRYDNRIDTVANLLPNPFAAYDFEGELGPTVIQRNPTLSRVTELSQSPNWSNIDVADLSTIGGIVDARQQNLSVVRTSGLDFGGSVTFPIGSFQNELGVDGTYIFEFKNQTTARTPAVDVLNAVYNPIDLRFRVRNALRRGAFQASVFLNYTDSYYSSVRHDAGIASWSTIDLAVGYDFQQTSGLLRGLSTTLAVTNLTDKDPPLLPQVSGTAILRYDGANANALGRFIAFQIRKTY